MPDFDQILLKLWLRDSYCTRTLISPKQARREGTPRLLLGRSRSTQKDQQGYGRRSMVNNS